MELSHSLFWLSDEAWAAIEPHMSKDHAGARRVDGRRVISGIIHMLKCGGRWADCPYDYGPSTTVYNRWSKLVRSAAAIYQGPPLCWGCKRGRGPMQVAKFVAACNFAKRLKTLQGLTPYEFICKCWTNEAHRLTSVPHHQIPGPNI